MSLFSIPARDATYSRDLKEGFGPLGTDKPIWPIQVIEDVIDECAREVGAISQGQVLVQSDTELSPLPWQTVEHRHDGVLIDDARSSAWTCPRHARETWDKYQRRSTDHAITMVRALTARVRQGEQPLFVDLAWVTEDEIALFDLPGWARASLDAAVEQGRVFDADHSYASRTELARPVPGSFYGGPAEQIGAVPLEARYAFVWGEPKDMGKLQALQQLELLNAISLKPKAIPLVGALGGLRALSAGEMRVDSLDGLAGLSRLQVLSAGPCRRLTEFSALQQLRELRVLQISELTLTDLSPLAALTQLRGLHFGVARAVESLAPLAALKGLRSLRFRGTARDKSLAAVCALDQLTEVDLYTGSFPLEAFAELAAALPHTQGVRQSPFLPVIGWEATLFRCKCGAPSESYSLGKPRKLLCRSCNPDGVARYVARWELLVSAARARREQAQRLGSS